jgi:6-pyruvoyltetrahydropterin/6-carboxytetrahydropterin synthase
MQCIINRRAEFSASHRYWFPEQSELSNFEQFGACAQFPGHGHNYELFVSMLGEIDQYGMVLNLSDVKQVIKREITSQLDFSYLNDVWPELKDTLPTTENLARFIWHRLSPYLPLTNIRLYEHPRLWADYKGAGMQAYLTVGTHFSAAHRLALPDLSFEENSNIYGKCARPNGHGHNYHMEVTVKGEVDARTGMVVDLVKLHQAIDEAVIEPLDHTFLNKDIPHFETVVPTAENIAVYAARLLKGPIQALGATVERIKLIESPNNSCEIDCRWLDEETNVLELNQMALVS